jgi:hypothetical protein
MSTFLDLANICQISIEAHGSAYEHVQLLQLLATAGFYLLSYEINGAFHEACEYTLIHMSCLRRYGAGPVLGQYLL